MSERRSPHSLEAERAFLGACLMQPESVLEWSAALKAEAFYDASNRRIFSALVEAAEKGHPMDPIGLMDHMLTSGEEEAFGGVSYATGLPELVPSPEAAPGYARQIAVAWLRRRAIDVAHRLEHMARDPRSEIGEVVADAERALADLDHLGTEAGWSKWGDLLDDEMARLAEQASSPEPDIVLTTGIASIDRALGGGLEVPSFGVVFARPGMGKTALALNITETVASHGWGAAWLSMEMSDQKLVRRVLGGESDVNGRKLREPQMLEPAEWDRLEDTHTALRDRPIWVDDTPGQTLGAMWAKVRTLKRREPHLRLVVVDYLQLAKGTGESRRDQIGEVARGLFNLSKTLDVAVIALAQAARACELREDKMPRMGDLSDSSEIEKAADWIGACLLPFKYDENRDQGEGEMFFPKCRNGEVERIKLAWIGARFQWRERDRRYSDV